MIDTLCSGLICPDTSIGGKSTIRGELHGKTAQDVRSQLEAGSGSYDKGPRAERLKRQRDDGHWRHGDSSLVDAVQ